MKKNVFLISVLFISLFAFSQKVSSKLNFKPGQQIEISSTVKSTVTQEAMGQPIEFNIDGAVSQTYNVSRVADGNTTLVHKPKRIYVKFDGMGQNQTLDSDKNEDLDSEMGKPLKAALEKNYEITIDASGKVVSVKSSANQKESDKPGADMMGNISSQVGASLEPPNEGDASFFKVLPDKAIAKGESWSDSSAKEGKKSNTQYTLTDITDNEILVDFKGNSSTETKAEMMGMETVTKMKNNTTGKIIIDKATGIIKQKTSTNDATGTIDVMGQTVPLSSKTTTIINVK